MTLRVSGLPDQLTFVFSSFYHNDNRIGVLSSFGVDAVMESFEYIRRVPPADLRAALNWPTRRYLDSGMFTVMKKTGNHALSNKKDKARGSSSSTHTVISTLLEDYVAYLTKYGKRWDHIVEMDTDNIPGLGPGYALEARDRLRELVGDKLLPVWHAAADQGYDEPHGAWKRMIREFPYVSIGGDPNKDHTLYRHMVRMAHAQGVVVHGLGSTSPGDFKEIGWDTGDSTNWVAGLRYGRYSDLLVSSKVKVDARAVSKMRQVGPYLEKHGIDINEVLAPGKSHAKLYLSVLRELIRQDELRKWYAFQRDRQVRS